MPRLLNIDLKINEKYDQLPVCKQIVETIIDDIQSGKLKPGSALPGARKIADILNVSRSTVLAAYNQLEYEGWVESKPRVGTFVSYLAPENELEHYQAGNGKILSAIHKIVFNEGLPDINLTPMKDLLREYQLIVKKIGKYHHHFFSDPTGFVKLRIVLSQMLNRQRRIVCDENNLCIIRGGHTAFFLISQCLLEKDDHIIVEYPGHEAAWNTFEHVGASILYLPIDSDGLIISEIERCLEEGKKIKAVFITPNSQYPTTAVLSEPRRAKLIALANKFDFFVIEYDHCTDINHSNKKLLPVCSNENIKNYIYIGSFNSSVSPFLNMGYVVVNKNMMNKIAALKRIIDVNGDPILERAFYNFINDGRYMQHLKRSVIYYKKKRDFFGKLLNKFLKDKVSFVKPELGLAYWISPLKKITKDNYKSLTDELIAKEIKQLLTVKDYDNGNEMEGLLINFGPFPEKKLEEAVHIMAKYF